MKLKSVWHLNIVAMWGAEFRLPLSFSIEFNKRAFGRSSFPPDAQFPVTWKSSNSFLIVFPAIISVPVPQNSLRWWFSLFADSVAQLQSFGTLIAFPHFQWPPLFVFKSKVNKSNLILMFPSRFPFTICLLIMDFTPLPQVGRYLIKKEVHVNDRAHGGVNTHYCVWYGWDNTNL